MRGMVDGPRPGNVDAGRGAVDSYCGISKRRTELRKSLDGVMVLMGAADPVDLHDTFIRVNFAYLTGWQEPGAVLLLTSKEILFRRRGSVIARPITVATGPGEADAASRLR
jgi:hypothetical protein